MSTGHGRKAIIAAFFANLGIAIAKFAGFVVTGSGSMLAEGVHSVADTGNQGLLLLGGSKAKRPATPEFPFGYGRERYFWAFVVSVVLFTLGSAFALIEGVEKVRHPHELESAGWALGILGLAIVLEAWSFRTALREAHDAREGMPMLRYIRRAKAPEIPVVLLEDTGALIGLCVAFTAVLLTLITDNADWDGYGTVTIGVILGFIAIFLAIEMKGLLIGESATPDIVQRIRTAVTADPDVNGIIHLRTQHLGPDELLVAAKIDVAPQLTVENLATAIDRVESSIRAVEPDAKMVIYLEPDLARST